MAQQLSPVCISPGCKNPPLPGEAACFDCKNRALTLCGMQPLIAITPGAAAPRALPSRLKRWLASIGIILLCLFFLLVGLAMGIPPSHAAPIANASQVPVGDASGLAYNALPSNAQELYSFDNFNAVYLHDAQACEIAIDQAGVPRCLTSGARANAHQEAGSQLYTDWKSCLGGSQCWSWENDLLHHPAWQVK